MGRRGISEVLPLQKKVGAEIVIDLLKGEGGGGGGH